YEDVRFYGKNVVLQSIDPTDPAVVGSTIIDAGGSGHVVRFDGSEDSSCELSGFTLTQGGNCDFGGGIRGADEYGEHCTATISYCIITNNNVNDRGAGIFKCDGDIINCKITSNSSIDYYGGGLFACDGYISGCLISGNYAGQEGGGLLNCSGEMSNCTISDNHAGNAGGGLAYCMANIFACVISGNSSSEGGGLFACDGTVGHSMVLNNEAESGGGFLMCDSDIFNCIISGNSASFGGGLLDCTGDINNCTIASNRASEGGGLYGCEGTVINSILWGNVADIGAQLHESVAPTFCCIQGWATVGVAGNIANDPLFATGPFGDFYLSCMQSGQISDSPCIDAGSGFAESLGYSILTTRTDEAPDTGIVDLGCHFPAQGVAPPELPYSAAASPDYAAVSPIPVDFAAGDYGSGIKVVTLWYQLNGGAWVDSGLSSAEYYGTFEFSASEGDGTYSFCTIAEDNDGHVEAAPAFADDTTVFDTQEPTSSCESNEHENYSPIEVSFVANDNLAGIAIVKLWYQFNGGEWIDSGLVSSTDSGTFQFEPLEGDGTYEFATQAEDFAGNVEVATGADTQTVLEQGGDHPPVITAYLYETEYSQGSYLYCYLEVDNPGEDITADLYVLIVLPGGAILSYTGSALQYGLHPWIPDLYLEHGFHWGRGLILSGYISEGSPTGDYIYGAALSYPGDFDIIGQGSAVWFSVSD
ncbi:hypothetical protein J7M28_00660, partial [bacterium]|nr:hypothetical protein [bacterium]